MSKKISGVRLWDPNERMSAAPWFKHVGLSFYMTAKEVKNRVYTVYQRLCKMAACWWSEISLIQIFKKFKFFESCRFWCHLSTTVQNSKYAAVKCCNGDVPKLLFTAGCHADACSNFERISKSGKKIFRDHFKFFFNYDLTLTWRFATCLCSESTIHLRHGWPKPRKTPQNAFKTLLLLLKYSWLRDNHKSTESKKKSKKFFLNFFLTPNCSKQSSETRCLAL